MKRMMAIVMLMTSLMLGPSRVFGFGGTVHGGAAVQQTQPANALTTWQLLRLILPLSLVAFTIRQRHCLAGGTALAGGWLRGGPRQDVGSALPRNASTARAYALYLGWFFAIQFSTNFWY